MKKDNKTIMETANYTIYSSKDLVENVEVLQYGIEQIYKCEDGKEVITRIGSVSDDKKLVESLLQMLDNQDVYPATLLYVVEDFIAEVFSM